VEWVVKDVEMEMEMKRMKVLFIAS